MHNMLMVWAVVATVLLVPAIGLVLFMQATINRFTVHPNSGLLKEQYRQHLALVAGLVAWTMRLTHLVDRVPATPLRYLFRTTSSHVWLARYDVRGLSIANAVGGHANGDRYLRLCAQALRKGLEDCHLKDRRRWFHWFRRSAAYHIGGDEFAVVLVGAAEETARHFQKRVQFHVEKIQPDTICGVMPQMPGGIMSLEGAIELQARLPGHNTSWRSGLTQLISIWDDAADLLGMAQKAREKLVFFADLWTGTGQECRVLYEQQRVPDNMRSLNIAPAELDAWAVKAHGLGWTAGCAWRDDPDLEEHVEVMVMQNMRRRLEIAQEDLDKGRELVRAHREVLLLTTIFPGLLEVIRSQGAA